MITAVDTNIILDILVPDEPFSRSSKKLLEQYLSKGRLILCEVVFAELASWFASEAELRLFLTDTGIGLVCSNEKSLYVAGSRWAQYARKGDKNKLACSKCSHTLEVDCPRCGTRLTKRLRVLGDFLIGAHAIVHADCLLSRDLGIYRSYFSDLKLVGPP